MAIPYASPFLRETDSGGYETNLTPIVYLGKKEISEYKAICIIAITGQYQQQGPKSKGLFDCPVESSDDPIVFAQRLNNYATEIGGHFVEGDQPFVSVTLKEGRYYGILSQVTGSGAISFNMFSQKRENNERGFATVEEAASHAQGYAQENGLPYVPNVYCIAARVDRVIQLHGPGRN